MGAQLVGADVQQYERDGYLCPLALLDATETERFRADYEAFERLLADEIATKPAAQVQLLSETHTFLPWAFDLATRPEVTDAVESILGPDLLIWHSRWFTKRPDDGTFVSWHQDGTYWALEPPRVCTAWIALSRSDDESGCMRVVPGTHRAGQLPHRETFEARNALTRGQEIEVEVDEAEARSLVLEPGQFSLHHIGVVHGSGPNRSADARIGFAVRFVAPEVRQNVEHSFAMLVRGVDAYGHFELLRPPAAGEPDELIARGRRVVDRLYANLLSRQTDEPPS
jgi:ectoine hydroxylase-related dioxygenase (phytanoyl-CoA dioxygenase family)